MGTDLLQALKILTELAVNTVGQDLRVLAINDITLSVKEPGRDLVYRSSVLTHATLMVVNVH